MISGFPDNYNCVKISEIFQATLLVAWAYLSSEPMPGDIFNTMGMRRGFKRQVKRNKKHAGY